MTTRKEFLVRSGLLAAGTALLPSFALAPKREDKNLGVQLYTFREEMLADAVGTLEKIAALGIKQIETARSRKGLYYGLTGKEMMQVCKGLGMTLRSGHVALDKDWKNTLDQAEASGQEYLICSSMPSDGQTVDNYRAVAQAFNKAGEDAKQRGIKFGYHNHGYEFESQDGDPDLVHMELDLGWVVAGGKDPLDYFKRFKGRFPLWHLKDMELVKNISTEFGKGGLDIPRILKHKKESGIKYIFLEQEEYASSPFESMAHNMKFMGKI